MRVVIDRRTGKLRAPTATETAVMSAAAPLVQAASESYVVFQYPDGTLAAVLDEGFLNYAVAAVNADGSITGACVDALGNTEVVLLTPPPAAPSALEER